MTIRHNYDWIWHVIITLAFCGIAISLIVHSTANYGPGLHPDSVAYLTVSERIVGGYGPTLNDNSLISHWPPLYPIAIASVATLLDMTPMQSSRWMGISLGCMLIILFNLISNELGVKLLGTLYLNAFLISSPLFLQFSSFLSEGLFIVLELALIYSFFLFKRYLNFKTVIVMALIAGLLTVTRYAGFAFIAAVGFAIVVSNEKRMQGIKYAFLFGLTALLMPLGWMTYLKVMSTDTAIRTFDFHMLTTAHLYSLLDTMGMWLFPTEIDIVRITGLCSLCAVVVGIILLKGGRNHCQLFHKNSLILWLSPIVYVVFLFVSITMIDISTPLDSRILSPAIPLLLLLTWHITSVINTTQSSKLIVSCLLGVILAPNIKSSYAHHHYLHMNGSGYNGKLWRESETLIWAKQLSGCDVYTNGAEALSYLMSERLKSVNVFQLPLLTDIHHQRVNHQFNPEWESLQYAISAGDACIVYFNRLSHRKFYPTKSKLLDSGEQLNVHEFADGLVIYQSHPNGVASFRCKY